MRDMRDVNFDMDFSFGLELGEWNFTEIMKLHDALEERKIKHIFRRLFDGYQIITNGWDVVLHYGSYGHTKGLMEGMGEIVAETIKDDDVEGNLTCEDVLKRI